jgi:hypothetical protein
MNMMQSIHKEKESKIQSFGGMAFLMNLLRILFEEFPGNIPTVSHFAC